MWRSSASALTASALTALVSRSTRTNRSALAIEFIAAAALDLAIGLFSFRVQPIFFAIATPAVAYAFNAFALQLSGVTAARTAAKVPEALQLGCNLVKDKAFGVVITGKIRVYYLSSAVLAPRSCCC
jgi:ABC-type branched-subunit amino acid transport system permease subunit